MDYKKAYKEARKRAEEIFTNECSSESTKKCCIEIFPDLANKELSNFEGALFSAFSDAWQQYLLGEEVDVEQWTKEHSEELLEAAKEDLHPVEKTDEQQPTEWSCPYGKNETADRLVSLAECLEMDGDCLFNGYSGTECGKFLRDLAKKQVECRPAEWSEEDEIHKLHTIQLIEDVKEWSEKDGLHHFLVARSMESISWLKFLPERFNLQLTQGWSEEDENYLEEIISNLRYAANNRKTCSSKLAGECIHWLEIRVKSLRPQSKQEWSEEDDAIHTRVLGALGKAFMGVLPTKPSQEDIEWFKLLPERFNLQPKQEWGEEDEKTIDEAVKYIENYAEYVQGGFSKQHVLDVARRVDSLRPQPHWKPSEEQMETLKSYAEDSACLNELYDDLEKL